MTILDFKRDLSPLTTENPKILEHYFPTFLKPISNTDYILFLPTITTNQHSHIMEHNTVFYLYHTKLDSGWKFLLPLKDLNNVRIIENKTQKDSYTNFNLVNEDYITQLNYDILQDISNQIDEFIEREKFNFINSPHADNRITPERAIIFEQEYKHEYQNLINIQQQIQEIQEVQEKNKVSQSNNLDDCLIWEFCE